MLHRLLPKVLCLASYDLFKLWEITDNISEKEIICGLLNGTNTSDRE